MKPWFKNFHGSIEPLDHQRYVVNGEIASLSDTKVEITELPVKTWTNQYKEMLEGMLNGNEKQPALIHDYKFYNTDTTVKFIVHMNEDDNEPKEKDDGKGPDYDYLLGMPMWDLTQEKKDKICKQRDTKNTELKKLKATTINTMWTKDLDEFIAKFDEVEKQEKKEIDETEWRSDNNIVKLPGGTMTCFLCSDVEPTTSLATVVDHIATVHNTAEASLPFV